MSIFAKRIACLEAQDLFNIRREISQAEQEGIEVIRLTMGEPNFETPPEVADTAISNILKGNTRYADPAGTFGLREAIAKYVASTRGIDVEPGRVVVLPGAQPAIFYTLLAYVDPGDQVVYPSPCFPIYESWLPVVGATQVPIALREENGFLLDPCELASLVGPRTKVIIICSPSNPTGAVLTREILERAASVISRKCGPDARICSDEIYDQILFDGMKHISIASLPSMSERTIIVGGHSKTFAMTGWRIGFAVLPSVAEARAFSAITLNLLSCVPPFIQEAAREALLNPRASERVINMVAAFQERRDYAVSVLNDIPGVHCHLPAGAFYVFPNVSGLCERLGILEYYERLSREESRGTSPTRLLAQFLLYEHGLAVFDRRSFGVSGSDGQHFLRLSIATDQESLRLGLGRMANAAKDIGGFADFVRRRFRERAKVQCVASGAI